MGLFGKISRAIGRIFGGKPGPDFYDKDKSRYPWAKGVLYIYISPGLDVERGTILNAFDAWNSALGNRWSIHATANMDEAQIHCSRGRPHDDPGKAARTQLRVVETPYKRQIAEIEYWRFSFESALHEAGHALGVPEHSDEKADCMYGEENGAANLTKRDVNTIRLAYGMERL